MEYLLLILLVAGALYGIARWRRVHSGPEETCPKCGAGMHYRERSFRGGALERLWECSDSECGHRRPG